MSTQRVLAAAAALREFSLEEVAVFCDEPPSVIVKVLENTAGAVTRLRDGPTGRQVWRVQDPEGLRRRVDAEQPAGEPLDAPADKARVDVSHATRLQYAEQTLIECGRGQSSDERRVLLATAMNHLRQVVANTLPPGRPWWAVELSPIELGVELSRYTDAATFTRLQLDVEVASLTEHDLTGRPVATKVLTDTVQRLQPLTSLLDQQRMHGVVGRFFDLVIAQVAPNQESSVAAPGRLLTALARRRVRAEVEHSLDGAMRSLVPLLTNIGRDDGDRQHGLYEVLADLPGGREHIVVYSDLLQLLPRQFGWQAAAERLPGALTEAVTESATSSHLKLCANMLEQDLLRSPYGSEPALIGSAVHVFHQLAEKGAGFDDSIRSRSDRTCCELLSLAKALT